MGSINTSDYEKKQLAAQSLEYNLKDKMFCELFPETVEVSFVQPCVNHSVGPANGVSVAVRRVIGVTFTVDRP